MLDSLVRVSRRVERDHVVRNERQELNNSDGVNSKNLAFERSPYVNPQMRERTQNVSATYAQSFIHIWTCPDTQGKQQHRHRRECQRHAPISPSKTGPTHFPSSNFMHF